MKFISIIFLLTTTMSFAQNMANTESYKTAYKEMADGTTRYIGHCLTHEDYKGKKYTTTKVIQKYVEPRDFSVSELEKLVDKIGLDLMKKVIHIYFDWEKPSSQKQVINATKELIDDITVKTIQLKGSKNSYIQFNVGYGGGNGGYLVLRKTTGGQYKKISHTGDGDLEFCDAEVWQ